MSVTVRLRGRGKGATGHNGPQTGSKIYSLLIGDSDSADKA